ncbi:MAG: glycine zipper domain-containing protein [Pseudomonadota bacterium]
MKVSTIVVLVAAAGLLAGCARGGGGIERETAIGTGLGAAAGAGIGELVTDDPIFGAVAGGAIGALASNLYGQGDQPQQGMF